MIASMQGSAELTRDQAPALPLGRVAVTVAGAGAFLAARYIPLPLLERDRVFGAFGGMTPMLSIGALGLVPIVVAFVIVEIMATALPRWRALRHQDAGRASLARAAEVLALILAAVQAWGLTRFLETTRVGNAPLVSDSGADFRVPVFVTLVAGTCLTLALARAIDEHGAGRGMSILLAALGLEAVPAVIERVRTDLEFGQVQPRLPLVLLVVVAGSLLVLSGGRRRQGGLRIPTPGLDPVFEAARFVGLGLASGALRQFAAMTFPALLTDVGLLAIRLGVVLALTVALSHLYNARANEKRRAALPGAIFRSVIYLVAMSLAFAAEPLLDLLGLVTVCAVALDLGAELRCRIAHGELVPVMRSQKPDDADDAVLALREAAIPAISQGATHRSLLHFFGPFVPVDVLVPREHAEQARAIAGPEGRVAGTSPF
jgi:hypothetical protein